MSDLGALAEHKEPSSWRAIPMSSKSSPRVEAKVCASILPRLMARVLADETPSRCLLESRQTTALPDSRDGRGARRAKAGVSLRYGKTAAPVWRRRAAALTEALSRGASRSPPEAAGWPRVQIAIVEAPAAR